MSFDGLFTNAICEELSSVLKGGRISKIHQPFKNEMIMIVRANGKNHKVLFSAHPNYARIQITNHSYENPNEPPMFCMLLRKHLEGYFIEDIQQIGLDRIIVFDVKGRNELGDPSSKQLIIEIMGRHSNIILVDKEKNMILDSIKHISYAVNSYRAILPGQEYIFPPKQDKFDTFQAKPEDILRKIDFNSGKIDQQLVNQFAGVSPLFAREVMHHAGLANRETIPSTFLSFATRLKSKKYEPSLMTGGKKEEFYHIPLFHLNGEVKPYNSLSELLDRFYFGKAERDRVKQQGHDLERFILNEKTKNENKIAKLKQTITEAEKANQFQLAGELLTANMHLIKKGQKEIEVTNYYDGTSVHITLDPLKTPSENAQKYFTKYQKSKKALSIVIEQIAIANREIEYFEGLIQQLATAAPKDIEEIREELIEQGYIRERTKKKSKKLPNKNPELEAYKSSDGTEILVGKNNKQNDYLSNKLARKDEIWMHTKDIPGSHVVIRHSQPSENTIREAAILAAYYSKARESSSVPVDYTTIRHVKKPSGAKPGFVIYDHQQTVYVTPDEDIVLSLKKKK